MNDPSAWKIHPSCPFSFFLWPGLANLLSPWSLFLPNHWTIQPHFLEPLKVTLGAPVPRRKAPPSRQHCLSSWPVLFYQQHQPLKSLPASLETSIALPCLKSWESTTQINTPDCVSASESLPPRGSVSRVVSPEAISQLEAARTGRVKDL